MLMRSDISSVPLRVSYRADVSIYVLTPYCWLRLAQSKVVAAVWLLRAGLGARIMSSLQENAFAAMGREDLLRALEMLAKNWLAHDGRWFLAAEERFERALSLRLYAVINTQRTEWSEDRRRLRFSMDVCRVQDARRRKGLPDFPCKSVGIIEFETFATTNRSANSYDLLALSS